MFLKKINYRPTVSSGNGFWVLIRPNLTHCHCHCVHVQIKERDKIRENNTCSWAKVLSTSRISASRFTVIFLFYWSFRMFVIIFRVFGNLAITLPYVPKMDAFNSISKICVLKLRFPNIIHESLLIRWRFIVGFDSQLCMYVNLSVSHT